MEYKTYVKGKNSIEATEHAYETLFKQQGFKPAAVKEGAKDDPDRGSNSNNGKGAGVEGK